MKVEVITLEAAKSGSIDLAEEIFGVSPRKDVLHRVVRWQMAKRQQGTHSVLTRSEVSYSTRKIYKQKGSGGARHGSRRAPIFRKGGVYKGPTPRSHEHNLTKKFRALGLKHALSSKFSSGALVVVENIDLDDAKTKRLAKIVNLLGWKRALIVDEVSANTNFCRAARNIEGIDILPTMGVNVYDILRKDTLVLTRSAIKILEERLK